MFIKKLIVLTQYRENYGAHDWNGEGECPQYWKNKGGEDYIVAKFTQEQLDNLTETEIAEQAVKLSNSNESIVWTNPCSTSRYIGHRLIGIDELTSYESDQMEYDGEIRYPTRDLSS